MTRTAYDTVARSYARLLDGLLETSTWDRMVLAAFAEHVDRAGGGLVADLGCGTGRITAHLDQLGLDVLGIDLSPGMVAEARRRHPDMRFEVGSIAALDLPDAHLAGALAWYSLIHTPPAELPRLVHELARVLRPGGWFVTAFQVGDELVAHEHAYGHDVRLDSYRLDVEHVAGLLEATGIEVTARLVRGAEGVEKTPQAYLVGRRR